MAEPLASVQSEIWTTTAVANTKLKDGVTVLRVIWDRCLEKADIFGRNTRTYC